MIEYQLPVRRRLYLMRHGDVTYFDETGRAIDPDTVPLNENGRAQASAAGEAFARPPSSRALHARTFAFGAAYDRNGHQSAGQLQRGGHGLLEALRNSRFHQQIPLSCRGNSVDTRLRVIRLALKRMSLDLNQSASRNRNL